MSCIYTYNGIEFSSKEELGKYLSENGAIESAANIEYIKDGAAPLSKNEINTNFDSEVVAFGEDKLSINENGYNGVNEEGLTEQDLETLVNEVVPFNDTKVKESIDNWLKTLGVSIEYREGMTVNAMADLLNNLILVGNGALNEDKIEEIAHFAREMWSGKDLDSYDWQSYVRKSDKYAKYNTQYREQYVSEGLSGNELERKVDLEILDKILADVLFDTIANPERNNREYTGFFGAIKKFLNYMMNYFNNNAEVERLLYEIADSLNRADAQNDVFANRAFEFSHYYSMKEAESLRLDINAALDTRLAKERAVQMQDIQNRKAEAERMSRDIKNTGKQIFDKTGMRLENGNWVTNESIYDDAVVLLLKQEAKGLASRNPSSIATFLSTSIEEVAKLTATMKQLINGKLDSGVTLTQIDSTKISYYVNEVTEAFALMEDEINRIPSSQIDESNRARLKNSTRDLLSNISELSRMWNEEGEFLLRKMINEQFEATNTPQIERKYILDNLQQTLKEVNGLVSNFLSQNSQGNIFSSILLRIVTEGKNMATRAFSNTYVNGYARKIKETNVDFKQLMSLQETRDGNVTGNMINRHNLGYLQHLKHNEMKRRIKEGEFANIAGSITEEQIDKIDQGESAKNILSENQFLQYQNMDMELESEVREGMFTEEYYKESEATLFKIITDTLGITDKKELKEIAKEMRSRTAPLYREKAEIYEKYKDKNKKVNFNNITPVDLARIDELNTQLKMLSNEYDVTGIKKTGVDAQIAMVINARNKSFSEAQEKETPEETAQREAELSAYMQDFKANGNKLSWLKMTGLITFADDFQDDMESKLKGVGSFEDFSNILNGIKPQSYKEDKLKEEDVNKAKNLITILEGLTGVKMKDNSAASLEEQYEILKQQKAELLKPYKKGQEVNVQSVPTLVLKRFEEVSDALAALNSQKKLSEEEKAKRDEIESKVIQTEQYEEDLKSAIEAGLKEEFLKNHTKNGRPKAYYTKFINSIQIKEYSESRFPAQEIIETRNPNLIYKNTEDGKYYKIDNNGIAQEISSPFQRKAVNEVMIPTNEGGSKKTYMVAKIQPNGAYRESKNMDKYTNPKYKENIKNKHPQYKDEVVFNGVKYSTINEDFFNTFGIDKNDENETPTRNIELFTARQLLLDMKEKVDRENLAQKNAYFVLPQVYRGAGEAAIGAPVDIKKTFKSILEQKFFANEQDVAEMGEAENGNENAELNKMYTEGKIRRNAPKMYVSKINPSLLSRNVLAMYMKYAAKVVGYHYDTLSSIKTERLLNILKNKSVENGSEIIRGENSNLHKNADTNVKNMLYGSHSMNLGNIKVAGKTINVSKTLNTLKRFASNLNLGRNIWVATAGTASSYVNYVVQQYSGFNGSNKDFSMASEMAHGAFINGIGEFAKPINENKFFMIMNEFGLEENLDKLATKASMSKGQNVFMETVDPYALMKGMDMPHKLRSLTLALLTYRKIGDKMYSYQSFMTAKTDVNEGNLSVEEAQQIWDANIENSLLNKVEVKDGKIIMPEEYEDAYNRASSVAKTIASKLTGNQFEMDMPPIFRNPILGLLGMHKGWFYSALNQRFGLKTFNSDLGISIEGNYLVAWRNYQALFGQLLFYKNIMDNTNLSFAEKTAIKKVVADIYATLVALAVFMMLNALADDDEEKDNWALQQLAYLSTRVYGEISGGTAIGLASTTYETAKNPVGAMSRHFDLFLDTPDTLINYDDKIQKGNFKGWDKGSAYLLKWTTLQNLLKFKNQREANQYTKQKQHSVANWLLEFAEE